MIDQEKPKVFISYSWTNQDHIQWVVDLAHELGDAGVHVILDKFDLREGDDSIQFMERIVNDPTVQKVLLICDRVYAEKTNARAGGAGVEAQIISPRIYADADKGKFVAVLSERDAEGNPYLPTYYASRIYIDLSNQDKYNENFESLIRWINNKPLYRRREIGQRPAYLDEPEELSLGTAPAYRRAIEAIKSGKPSAAGALSDYFQTVSTNLERLRLQNSESEDWNDVFFKNLSSTIPLRNELNQTFEAIATYGITSDFGTKTVRFFESLVPYFDRPEGLRSWSDSDFDNFRFLGYEFFIHALAIFIGHERFDLCSLLLNSGYYNERSRELGKETISNFTVFNNTVQTLSRHNDAQTKKYTSPIGKLISERLVGTQINLSKLVQADLIAYIRSDVDSLKSRSWDMWWPHMYVYGGRHHGALEIFARAQSAAYFEKVKEFLGVSNVDDFAPLIEAHSGGQRAPRFNYDRVNVGGLIGIDKLASRP